MSDPDALTGRVAELKSERAALEAQKSKEDLRREVEDYIEVARAQAAGASRIVLGGQAVGEQLMRVLFEDLLADEGLADRLVARLEREGLGQITDRQRGQKLGKLDAAIKVAEVELREARRAAAIRELEEQFAGEAA